KHRGHGVTSLSASESGHVKSSSYYLASQLLEAVMDSMEGEAAGLRSSSLSTTAALVPSAPNSTTPSQPGSIHVSPRVLASTDTMESDNVATNGGHSSHSGTDSQSVKPSNMRSLLPLSNTDDDAANEAELANF